MGSKTSLRHALLLAEHAPLDTAELLADAYHFLAEEGCINFGILQNEPEQGGLKRPPISAVYFTRRTFSLALWSDLVILNGC